VDISNRFSSSKKLEVLDSEKHKLYKSTELMIEAEDIILKKELGKRPVEKMWTILDAPRGSYYGPITLHKFPSVRFKKIVLSDSNYHKAYCVSLVHRNLVLTE